jgi:hypothetical protein
VGARIGYAAAWASLFTAGALVAGGSGNVCLAVPLAVLAVGTMLVIPFAPYLPGLHRLPIVGSPRLEVTYRLNGSTDLRTTLRQGSEQTCILEVGVKNPERWQDLHGAWMNLLLPSGVKIGRCNQVGEPEGGGKWEEFHRHRLGAHERSDYWNDFDWKFPASFSRAIRFKLWFREPGEYPILFKLGAAALHDGLEEERTMHVDEGEPDLDATFGELITTGERLRRAEPNAFAGDAAIRGEAFAWFMASTTALHDAGVHEFPEPPEGAEARELKEQIRFRLVALYVVRDERGRSEDK